MHAETKAWKNMENPFIITGSSNQITSAAFIKKYNLRSASSVQSAIKKLLEYHLVSTSQATYYIDDQLMGLWLKM